MSLDSEVHNFKIIGLLIILSLVLSIVSVSAANNSSIAVSDHYIKIDPIGNHTIGEVFFINGTTNLPVSENLTINIAYVDWIRRGSRMATSSDVPPLGEGVLIRAIPISPFLLGMNQWSVNITDTINVSGEYSADVFSYVNYACNTVGCGVPETDISGNFFLLPANNSQFSQATTQIPPGIQSPISITLVPSPSRSAPLPLVLPIAAITTIVFLISVYGKKGE